LLLVNVSTHVIMNKLVLLTIIIPAILTFGACQSNTKQDDANAEPDTTSNAKLSTAVEQADSQFIFEAAGNNIARAELGKLAQQRGFNRRVKNLGTMMITGHSKINGQIKTLATIKKIPLPTVPDTGEQKNVATLSKKTGKDFDSAYINYMINAYEKNIMLFETAAKKCQDPDIKSFAVKTLPVLQGHLDAINAIKESME